MSADDETCPEVRSSHDETQRIPSFEEVIAANKKRWKDYELAVEEAARFLSPYAAQMMGKQDGTPFGMLFRDLESSIRSNLGMSTREEELQAEHEARQAKKTATQRRRKSIDPSVRLHVYERDAYSCVVCGTNQNLTLDHIIPVAKGGGNEESNLQTMCLEDNIRKGAK